MKRLPLSEAVSIFVGAVAVGAAIVPAPRIVLAVIGVPLLFVLPGFALVSVVLPAAQRRTEERLLASVGLSIAIATCLSVLLAATRIGLSRQSLAVSLGSVTVVLASYCFLCSRPYPADEPLDPD